MSSCGLSICTAIMILDKLVLRSAPHVLRLGRYESPIEEEDVPEYVLLTVSKNLKNLMNE